MQNCHNFQEELPLMSTEEISQWLLNESVLFYSGQAAGLNWFVSLPTIQFCCIGRNSSRQRPTYLWNTGCVLRSFNKSQSLQFHLEARAHNSSRNHPARSDLRRGGGKNELRKHKFYGFVSCLILRPSWSFPCVKKNIYKSVSGRILL